MEQALTEPKEQNLQYLGFWTEQGRDFQTRNVQAWKALNKVRKLSPRLVEDQVVQGRN